MREHKAKQNKKQEVQTHLAKKNVVEISIWFIKLKKKTKIKGGSIVLGFKLIEADRRTMW